MGYVLGVDLGTTWSAAAVGRVGRVEPCTLGTTAAAIPSVVVLREDGEILTGEAADRRSMSEPTRTAREFKRRLGDPVPIIVGGTPYGVEALMAHLLAAIVADVSEREGGPPDMVVITHPANYGDYKQGLLMEAARLAGLDLARVRLITEPEAAAIAYAHQQRVEPGDVVAVYDFGGGTFDAALVRTTATGFELMGTPEGMERLGGIDVDAAVFAHVDAATDGMIAAADSSDPQVRAALARLRDECRKAKEALSSDTDTVISVALSNLQTEVRLTRDELERMIRPRIGETVAALLRAIDSSGVPRDQVTRILLVGGSSRMPIVGQLVREGTGLPISVDAHPKLAIATGAASLTFGDPTGAAPTIAPVAGGGVVAAEGSGLGGLAAAAGAGAAAAAAGAAILGAGGSAAVAGASPSGAAAVGLGPTGAAGPGLGPTGAATPGVGPGGAASPGVGPSGAPPAHGAPPAGHGPTPGANAAKPAAKVAKKGRMAIAAGVGAAVTIGVIAVVATRGDDKVATATTTAAARSTTVAANSTTALSSTTGVATTVAGVTQRGLPGVVTSVAGNGKDNGLGAPGAATAVSLGTKVQYAIAANGDIYVSRASLEVLKISNGQVSVFGHLDAGGGPATGGIAVASDGSVFVATGSTITKFSSAGGAGTVVLTASAAGLSTSLGPIALDGGGNLYLADGSRRITRLASGGGTAPVAGTGKQGPFNAVQGDGGPANLSPLGAPAQVVIDASGNLLIGDSAARRVRRVAKDGTITTIAGGGATKLQTASQTYAPDGTAPTDLMLADVTGLAVDAQGRIYVADAGSDAIFRFGTTGGIELVIADQKGGQQTPGLPANQTRVTSMNTLAVDAKGNLLYLEANVLHSIAGAGS